MGKTDDADEVSVSGPELGRRLGLTPTSVSKLGGDGVLIRTSRGRYKLWPSVLSYVEKLRRSATQRESSSAKERARLLKLQADQVQLRLDRDRGGLIAESVVETEWAEIVTRVRNAILTEPERIGAELGLPRESVAVIAKHLRDALSGLARSAK